jgi:hypothetical protein
VSETLPGAPSGRFAKRLFLLCLLEGPSAEFAANPNVREAYLGVMAA